jgi:hypothetical protein
MIAMRIRYRRLLAGALALTLVSLPLMAAERFHEAVAVRQAVLAMVQSVVDRDAAAFGGLFTTQDEAMLWDQEHRFVSAPAIQAWMDSLLQLVPEAAVYSASAPRIILNPDGDENAAWVSVDWEWAVWQGHATALLRREGAEWRFYRVDFFGVKVVGPEPDMDPTWATQTIGAVSAAADAAAQAIHAGDIDAINEITTSTPRFVEADGFRAEDAIAAIGAHLGNGDLDDFDPATSVISIDAEGGVALVYDPDAPTDSLRMRLTLDGEVWLVEAAGLDGSDLEPTRAVGPQGLRLTTWVILRSLH